MSYLNFFGIVLNLVAIVFLFVKAQAIYNHLLSEKPDQPEEGNELVDIHQQSDTTTFTLIIKGVVIEVGIQNSKNSASIRAFRNLTIYNKFKDAHEQHRIPYIKMSALENVPEEVRKAVAHYSK